MAKSVKKAKAKKTAVKSKKGARYVCNSCGMGVTVDKDCQCQPCDIVCCGQGMTPLKLLPF